MGECGRGLVSSSNYNLHADNVRGAEQTDCLTVVVAPFILLISATLLAAATTTTMLACIAAAVALAFVAAAFVLALDLHLLPSPWPCHAGSDSLHSILK